MNVNDTTHFNGRTLTVAGLLPVGPNVARMTTIKEQYAVTGSRGASGMLLVYASGQRSVLWLARTGTTRREEETPASHTANLS